MLRANVVMGIISIYVPLAHRRPGVCWGRCGHGRPHSDASGPPQANQENAY